MTYSVLLSIRGLQCYMDQEPDVIEFTTEGVLKHIDDRWEIEYDESSLTGMEGVTTNFCIEKDCMILTRTGKLNSQMVFKLGQVHESLYRMDFGALLLSVCATDISWKLDEHGGIVDLKYNIEIEHGSAGTVDYHMDIKVIQLKNTRRAASKLFAGFAYPSEISPPVPGTGVEPVLSVF